MANGNDRLDRIEGVLERVGTRLDQVAIELDQVAKRQNEMAARQQYHDEAFERHDEKIRQILEAVAADGENIRALARIAELHHERLDRLEGGELA